MIRVDQGSEFVSRDLDLWAYQRGITLDFSRPGKHRQRLHRVVQRQVSAGGLNAHWFHESRRCASKMRGLA